MNERIDLSALDPFGDEHRTEAFVASVLERSAFELARRRAGQRNGSVFSVVAGWARPALAAAVVLMLLSVAALQMSQRQRSQLANTGVVEELSVPQPVDSWLIEDRTPSRADLMLAIEEDATW